MRIEKYRDREKKIERGEREKAVRKVVCER